MAETAEQLRARVTSAYKDTFGKAPDVLVAAPGRVNLIGEHTDYNDGFALPCAIERETVVAIGRRDDSNVHAFASDYNSALDQFDAALPIEYSAEDWKNYVRGMVLSLQAEGMEASGLNIAFGGNIPSGAGLSSSASLCVALGMAVAKAENVERLGPGDFALIAQRAENDFVGCACGIMDQLASAKGEPGFALLMDCRSLETRTVAMPNDLAIMIVHSGVERGLVDSAYNERRAQCEVAAKHYGVVALRDLDYDRLIAERGTLDDVTFRRARHIVTENARVLDMTKALEAGDMAVMGELMQTSHISMRDDFEITVPPVDALVALLGKAIGAGGGARMTGGGFGGCVVALLPQAKAAKIEALVRRDYQPPNGQSPLIIVTKAAAGAQIL